MNVLQNEPSPQELFDTWLYGTSKEVSWKIANETNDKKLIQEIIQEFMKYCKEYGFKCEENLN